MLFSKVDEVSLLRSLYYMLDSGMSVHEAISEISGVVKDKKLSAKLATADELMMSSGYKFTDAIEAVGLFERFLPIIRTGQETGNLVLVLKEIIAVNDSITNLKKKIKTMVFYPIALVFFSVAIGFGITFLLEKIITTLPAKDIKGTAAYDVASFIVNYREFIFPAYALILLGLIYFIVMNASRIPVIKDLFNTITVGQTFKMLALALRSGLSLKDAIDLTATILKEKKWKKVFEVFSLEVQERNLYDLIDEMSDFMTPPDLLIIKSNIKAGNLSEGFEFVGSRKIGDSYEILERTSPIIQIGAFVFVAGQIVVLMSPLYFLLYAYMDKA